MTPKAPSTSIISESSTSNIKGEKETDRSLAFSMFCGKFVENCAKNSVASLDFAFVLSVAINPFPAGLIATYYLLAISTQLSQVIRTNQVS